MKVKYIKDLDTNKNINVKITFDDGRVIHSTINDGDCYWEKVKEWVAAGNTIEEAD